MLETGFCSRPSNNQVNKKYKPSWKEDRKRHGYKRKDKETKKQVMGGRKRFFNYYRSI
jgi:hypothetical protein